MLKVKATASINSKVIYFCWLRTHVISFLCISFRKQKKNVCSLFYTYTSISVHLISIINMVCYEEYFHTNPSSSRRLTGVLTKDDSCIESRFVWKKEDKFLAKLRTNCEEAYFNRARDTWILLCFIFYFGVCVCVVIFVGVLYNAEDGLYALCSCHNADECFLGK